MSRFLLVSPPVYDFKLYDQWMNPFGLMAVSDLLKQGGHEVFFIDGLFAHEKTKKFGTGFFKRQEIPLPESLKFMERPYYRFGKPFEIFSKEIEHAEFDAAFVGGFLTYWYPGVFEAVRLLKTFHPHKPVVLGGVYPTLCPDHARTFSGAHRVFQGSVSHSNLKTLLESLNFKLEIKNPLPGLDLNLVGKKPFFSLLLSSGCPYRCTYCASSVLNPEHFFYRLPEPGFFKQGYDEGIRDLAFLDDALLYDLDALKKFIGGLEEQSVFFRYHTPNGLHLNRITPETAWFLKASGFETLRFGLESLEPEWESKSGGKAKWNTVVNAVQCLKEAGFSKKQLGLYLLLSPESRLDAVEETLLKLEDLRVNLHLNRYSPIPGTPDFIRLSQQFPEIEAEPLFQNDSVFLKKTGIFDPAPVYRMRKRIQDYNALEG